MSTGMDSSKTWEMRVINIDLIIIFRARCAFKKVKPSIITQRNEMFCGDADANTHRYYSS